MNIFDEILKGNDKKINCVYIGNWHNDLFNGIGKLYYDNSIIINDELNDVFS